MHNIVLPSLAQLLAQAPVLLVYVAGVILALVYWRRWPTPSLLVLVSSALLLLLAVGQTVATQYIIVARAEFGWPHEKVGWMLSAFALAGSCLRAMGLGLLLAATFVRRTVAAPSPTGDLPGGRERL